MPSKQNSKYKTNKSISLDIYKENFSGWKNTIGKV